MGCVSTVPKNSGQGPVNPYRKSRSPSKTVSYIVQDKKFDINFIEVASIHTQNPNTEYVNSVEQIGNQPIEISK